jgi:hypothetical protein
MGVISTQMDTVRAKFICYLRIAALGIILDTIFCVATLNQDCIHPLAGYNM